MAGVGSVFVRGRLRAGAGAALLLAALALPWGTVLDAGAARFNTVRDFRADYALGIAWFRAALACNGLAVLAWPWLLRAFWPSVRDPEPRPHDRTDLRILLALFAGAIAVRLPGITNSLQHDEWHTMVYYVRHGPLVAATRYTGLTNHILASLLGWAGTKVFGMGELGLRAGVLLVSSLGAPALYGALRWRLPREWSLAGAVFYGLSAFSLCYSQEVRAYGIVVAGVPALFWLWEEIRRRPGPRALWLLAGVGTALVYARLVNVFVFAALPVAAAAIAAVEGREALPALRRTILAFLLAGLASFQLYAIALAGLFRTLRGDHPRPHVEYPDIGILLPSELTISFAPAWTVALCWILAFAGLAGMARRSPRALALILALAALSYWRFGGCLSFPRYQIQLLPIASVALAELLGVLGARVRPAALGLAGILLAAQSWSAVRYHAQGKLDFKGAAAWLDSRAGSVGTHVDSKTVSFYLRDPSRWAFVESRDFDRVDPDWFVAHTITLAGDRELAARLARTHREVWRKPTMWGFSLTVWGRR